MEAVKPKTTKKYKNKVSKKTEPKTLTESEVSEKVILTSPETASSSSNVTEHSQSEEPNIIDREELSVNVLELNKELQESEGNYVDTSANSNVVVNTDLSAENISCNLLVDPDPKIVFNNEVLSDNSEEQEINNEKSEESPSNLEESASASKVKKSLEAQDEAASTAEVVENASPLSLSEAVVSKTSNKLQVVENTAVASCPETSETSNTLQVVENATIASCPEAPALERLEDPQPLYPLQELLDAKNSEVIVNLVSENVKIRSKELAKDNVETIKPFTQEQLLALYRNSELEMNESFIDQFIENERNPQNSEFHELLQGYLRSRQKLVSSLKDVEETDNDATYLGSNLWILQAQTVTGMSPCADGVNITQSLKYMQASMNESTHNSLSQLLQQLREQIQESLTLHSYVSEVAHLQIESYIYTLLIKSSLKDVPSNAPVTILHPHTLTKQQEDENHYLRECISDLFSFQRRLITDKKFIDDTRRWLTHLVALLLRRATLGDHLFILNHVLRCPAGIGNWATCFVQPLPPLPWMHDVTQRYSLSSSLLDHSLTVLATLMLPIKARDLFLQSIGTALQSVNPGSYGKSEGGNLWVLVESDGEEDEDLGTMWLQWQENDVVSLLNQVPMADLFKHALMIHQKEELDDYDVRRTDEHGMLRLLAFGSRLLELLGQGFQTFNSLRFKHLTKRISRLIRHTVQYLSDHWEAFCLSSSTNSSLMSRLQVEYDNFFLRAINCILSSQMMGSWQFMAVLPYKNVSLPMMWQILWTLHHLNQQGGTKDPAYDFNFQENLKDNMVHLLFEEKLSQLPESEAFYLLTAFANMAKARDPSERTFICTVCLEVMEISFVNLRLRESLSKEGRDLLSSISTKHTFIMSVLLKSVADQINKVGMMALYLFRDLPLSLWKPDKEDLNLLKNLLLDNPLVSPANQLAKLVITGMNWADNAEGNDLFLSIDIHREIALLVVQAYAKFAPHDTNSGVIMWSLQQVLLLAQSLRQTAAQACTPQGLVTWAWDILLSLRLHLLDRPSPHWTWVLAGDAASMSADIPQLNTDPLYDSVLIGVKEGQPAALFVAVLMTTTGHSLKDLNEKGLNYLSELVTKEMYPAATHILSFILPFFYSNPSVLLKNERFLNNVLYIILADLTYTALAKSLVITEFPGKALQHFAAMIKFQIQQGRAYAAEVGGQAVRLWCQVLFQLVSSSGQKSLLAKWKGTDHIYYLLDQLFKVALKDLYLLDTLMETLARMVKIPSSTAGSSGVVSSILSLVLWPSGSGGTGWPSLLSTPTLPNFSCLFWGVFSVETQHMQMIQLSNAILSELAQNSQISPDVALKHVCSNLHLPVPVLSSMPIYRWALQSLEVDLEHPCLPLLWQNFFMNYLHRISPEKGSVGFRFFADSTHLSLLKKMKRRLNETSEHYGQLAKKLSEELDHLKIQANDESIDDEVHESELAEKINRTQTLCDQQIKLTKAFRSLSLWIEEPRLHDPALDFKSLPPQYDSERLKTLFSSEKKAWMDLVNMDSLQKDLNSLDHIWLQRRKALLALPPLFGLKDELPAPEKIIKRLKTYEESLPAPLVPPLVPLVPDVTEELLNNDTMLIDSVKTNCHILVQIAENLTTQLSKHMALDCEYLELTPNLYRNVETQTLVRGTCTASNGCEGPATFYLKYKEARMVNGVKVDIEQNRSSYKDLLQKYYQMPPQGMCCAAVFVENCITALVKRCRCSSYSQSSIKKMRETGVTLFHYLMALVDGTTSQYPPTRQFISSCLDALGQDFVYGREDQYLPLMQEVLARPSLAGLVAPLFKPAQASSPAYLQLYQVLVSKLCPALSSTLFVLLSKFDVGGWLRSAKPSLSERETLLESVFAALNSIGREPLDDMLVVLDIFRNHLQQLYQYMFPELFGQTLQLLLKGAAEVKISVCVWEDFICILAGGSHRPPTRSKESVGQWLITYASSQPYLHQGQLRASIKILSSFLWNLRHSSPQNLKQGLYHHLSAYFEPVAHLITMLSHAYISVASDKGSSLWEDIRDAYRPWLEPLPNGSLPFSQKTVNDASWMLKLFILTLEHLHNTCSEISITDGQSVLSQFWQWYDEIFAQSNVKAYVQSTTQEALILLPWQRFVPSTRDLDSMKRIIENELPDCHGFVGIVFLNIPWPLTVTTLQRENKEIVTANALSNISSMLIQLAWNPTVLKAGKLASIVASFESMSQLPLINLPEVQRLLVSATSTSDPHKFIQKSFPEAIVFRFLQSLVGLRNAEPFFDVEKRRAYVNSITHLLVKATPLFIKNNRNEFAEALITILEYCQPPPGTSLSFDGHCFLLSEYVRLLSPTSGPAECRTCALEVLLSKIQDWNSQVLPLVAVAFRTQLASASHLVKITETALLISCNNILDDGFGGWGQVVPLLTLEKSHWEDFFLNCISNSAHLCQNAFLLHFLPLCKGLSQEIEFLQRAADWCSSFKPSEESEPKLLLLWDKVLELSLRQYQLGGDIKATDRILLGFCAALQAMGEDKLSTGLLGSVGLGKRSPYSIRLRLMCRGVCAFVLCQLPTNVAVRLAPNDPGHIRSQEGSKGKPSQQALQALSRVESLKSNKQYAMLAQHADYVWNFILDARYSLRDSRSLIRELSAMFYPDKAYLRILSIQGST